MKKQIYSSLQFFCRNDDNDSISEILKEFQSQENLIDLLYDHGLFLRSAISHDNNALFRMLLDYMYDTKQIERDPKDNNTNQSIKYNKLQQVLKEAKKEFNTSKEVTSLIDDICHEDTDCNSDSDSLHEQDVRKLFFSFDNLENDFTFEIKLSGDNTNTHDCSNDSLKLVG